MVGVPVIPRKNAEEAGVRLFFPEIMKMMGVPGFPWYIGVLIRKE
jgi:hypothetical protein